MSEISLRQYQVKVFDACIDHFRSSVGADPAIIDCSVGAGKTAIAAFLTQHTATKGGRVLILARQSELVLQDGIFAERLGLSVSYYSNGLGSKSTVHNIIGSTEGTIARALDTAFKNWRPDLIIVDECHQVAHDDIETMMMRTLLHFKLLNPKCRILGMTGSPFRDNASIIGDFWKKCLAEISTEQLMNEGWLTPVEFGFPEHDEDSFDFSQLEQKYGTLEFTEQQMDEFRAGDVTLTQRIMAEVVHRTADDLGVLIFAQSKKHCQEVADALPPGSWAILTDDSTDSERADAFQKAKTGEIKYTINVGVCGTGWDCPYWQVIVYLRRVGSLVFLIQSIGRVLRLLIESGVDLDALGIDGRLLEIAASRKPFARALDYAGVMDRLGQLYDNPLLAQAQLEKAKREGSTIECPKCGAENSDKARRCAGEDRNHVRCDHFWIKQDCKHCGAHNDVTAAECRVCKEQLRDPNEKLLNKAYTDVEMVPVADMQMAPTKNGGILVKFILEGEQPDHGWPVEFFAPGGNPTAHRVWYNQFVKVHIRDSKWASKVYPLKKAEAIMKMRAMFDTPTHIAYRINEKGKFVIGRRRFSGGYGCEEGVEISK